MLPGTVEPPAATPLFVARHDDDELGAFVDPDETDYEDPMMHNTKRTWYPYAENDSTEDAPSPPADD